MSEDQRKRFLARSQAAIDDLIEEIDTLLLVASAERLDEEISRWNLLEMIEGCLHRLPPDQKSSVRLELPAAEVLITSALKANQIIFKNLLANALRYSSLAKPRPVIVIRSIQKNSNLILEITDNGIGFAHGLEARIFEPFYRTAEAKKMVPSGTGLGLTLVKRLGEQCGVEVESSSRGVDAGVVARMTWKSAVMETHA